MMASGAALLVAGLAVLLAAHALPPSSMRPTPDIVGERTSPRRDCPVKCSPNRAGAPPKHVCGNDGRTYPSTCHLRRQKCQHPNSNLKTHYRGKCRPEKNVEEPSPSCIESREFHGSNKSASSDKPVLLCDQDGNFMALQCFKVYCWCVEPLTGNPIPNTHMEHTKPDCSKARRKSSPPPQPDLPPKKQIKERPIVPGGNPGAILLHKKPKKACAGIDRLTFNRNLINLITVEMRRLPTTVRTEDYGEMVMEQHSSPSMQRRILELKFQTMDENRDGVLEKREYRSLRKHARISVTPRRCSRSFIQRCDKNKDARIDKTEWLQCLGLNSQRGPIKPEGPDTDQSSSSEMDSSEGRSCLQERKTALEQATGNNYVPQCTDDGKYTPAQCYGNTGYCFCVEEDTGKMVKGTTVLKSDPVCNSRLSSSGGSSKSNDKCPEDKKMSFIAEFKALMGAKIDLSGLKMDEMPANKYEKFVTAAFFMSLDKNDDKALDKREWKEFRKIVDERASLRQCGKKFLRFCDTNDDGRVTPAEWESCLNISRPPTSAFTDHSFSKRRGPNPLDTILKSD